MSGYDLAMVFTGALIVGLGWWQMPKRWRGNAGESDLRTGQLFLFGPAGRKGLRRGVPLLVVGGTVAYVPVAVVTITGIQPDGVLLDIVLGLVFTGFMAFVLMIPVYFFNRPKFVVPPPYRHELGAIAEWWQERQGRKQQTGESDGL